MPHKTFEQDYGRQTFFGIYYFEDNKLWIEDVHTFDDDEQRIEIDSINDKEIFDAVYRLVEKDKIDELNEEIENDEWERKYSHGEERWERLNGK